MWHYSDNDGSDNFDDLKDLEVVEIKTTDLPKEVEEELANAGTVKGAVRRFFLGRADDYRTGTTVAGSFWEQFKVCYLTQILIGINVFTYILQLMFVEGGEDRLVEWGSLSWPKVMNEGEFWRLFTCQVLHANVAHLLGNMLVLAVCGMMLERRFNRLRVLIIYLIGGFGASLVSMTIGHYNPTIFTINFYGYKVGEYKVYDIPSIGASGAIAAFLGAVVLYKLFWSGPMDGYYESSWKPIIEALVFFEIVQIVLGFFKDTPGVDNAAHIGGFVTGILVVFIYMVIQYRSQTAWD